MKNLLLSSLAALCLVQLPLQAGDYADNFYAEYEQLGLADDHRQQKSERFPEFDPDKLPRIHRQPKPVKPEDILMVQSCEELDTAITYLLPATYDYSPGFYNDPYNGAAIWGSTISEFSFARHSWLYLPYAWLIDFFEASKRHDAFYQVEKLRRAKAMKNCFVN